MEFVETEKRAILQHFVEGSAKGIGVALIGEHSLVKEIEEHMEMHTPFSREWHGLEKSVDQPAFAPTGFAIQVQTLRPPALCLGRRQ
ncbi:hypothetical protein D3C76_1655030 [compost metagenome]